MENTRSFLMCENAPVSGSGVRVAVLDTGVDPDHPDLAANIDLKSSKNCTSEATSIEDTHGHGTHIAGIIAGTGEASGGQFRGIAPGVELVIIKIASGVTGRGADVAAGVLHAMEVGVDIINYSGGQSAWSSGPPPWKWSRKLSIRDEAFLMAAEAGILCVAAAGNEGPQPGSIIRPAGLPEVLCVGALGPGGFVAPSSSRGPVYLDSDLPKGTVTRADLMIDTPEKFLKPDVVVPGGNRLTREQSVERTELGLPDLPGMVSTWSQHARHVDPLPDYPRYAQISGTSQATAVVSGLAALLLEMIRRTGFDVGENQGRALAGILRASARTLARDTQDDFGYGVLLWPSIAATLDDCMASDIRRATVINGPQIQLLQGA